MNERIQQLAEQAESIRLKYDQATMKTERIHEFDKQKFAQLIVRECMEVSLGCSHRDDDMGAIIARQIKQHFGVEESKGWVCSKCGTDRTKQECPKGYTAALTGECPMIGVAQ